ncbi:MAG: DUF3592 domain-containing protein [Chloroflexi bacterium]|nr:DUF3592 domain-containing protein [Chloroflexota bacterium]
MSELPSKNQAGEAPQLGFTKGFFNLAFIIALLGGLYGAYTAWQIEKQGDTTTGKIVRSEKHTDPNYDPSDVGDGFLYAPVVEFTVNEQAITFESKNMEYPPAYRDGEQVRVRYDFANPQSAEIDDWTDRWVFPLVVIPVMSIALVYLNFFMGRKK